MSGTSAEQEPLLPDDPEAQSTRDSSNFSLRERLAELLESDLFHKAIIFLTLVDTACVLADLVYTLLTPGCNPPGSDSPAWLEILATVSLCISGFFLVEIPLTLYTFGLNYYNPLGDVTHASLHLFDVLIILTTFILEVGLKGRERELASLLIVLRLWRLVKLVSGIAVGAGEIGEGDAKQLADTLRELEDVKGQLARANSENERLRARLTTTGFGEDD